MAQTQYTLVIPTYNRPEDLGRLLRFLAHQGAAFPVLVLDSSRPEVCGRNVEAARNLSLNVRIERFDPATSPWEKFSRGIELVETEFSSLCADDDLLLVSSIGPIIDFLAQHPDHSVAHGWYFQFYLSGALGLTGIVYRSPSIEAPIALDRLQELFANYEALTYAVHRTEVLRKALRRVQNVQSMLGRELLGGAIAVVTGKSARLPILYAGRSLGPSAPYVNWHPLHFLVSSPQTLFEEYSRYRQQLLEHYRECGSPADDATIALIDLIHLRYLSEYFKPKVLDYLYEQMRKSRSREEIIGGMWPVLLDRGGVEGVMQRSRLLRRLRDRWLPWLRGYHIRKVTRAHDYRVVPATTISGVARELHIYPEFDRLVALGAVSPNTEELADLLSAYE